VTALKELKLKEPLIHAQAVTWDDVIKAKIGKHRTDEEVEKELDGQFPTAGDLQLATTTLTTGWNRLRPMLTSGPRRPSIST
jgi:hypothetical protein